MELVAFLAVSALVRARARRRRARTHEGLDAGLWVRDCGPRGGDAAVVFLHGMMLDGRSFAAQEAALADRHRCISVDLRGLGRSAPACAPFDVWDMARDVLGVLERRGVRRAVLVGNSLGGFVAMRAALLAPERVAGLALISSRLGGTGPEVKGLIDAWTGAAPSFDGLVRTVGARIFNEELGPREAWAREQLEHEARRADLAAPGAALAGYDGVDADEAARLAMPALVVYGSADAGIAERASLELAAALPCCAGVVRVEGGPHAVNTTHAEEVNLALEGFLASVSSTAS